MEKCFTISICLASSQRNGEHAIEPLVLESIEIIFGQFKFIIQVGVGERPHGIPFEAEKFLDWIERVKLN